MTPPDFMTCLAPRGFPPSRRCYHFGLPGPAPAASRGGVWRRTRFGLWRRCAGKPM